MRIVIGAAGRRVYLVRWFQAAMRMLKIDGEVVVAESSPFAAANAAANIRWSMPRVDDETYRDSLLQLVTDLKPDLYFSVNDHELDRLADGIALEAESLGTRVLSLSSLSQGRVSDKWEMARVFQGSSIRVPRTVLGDDAEGVRELVLGNQRLVVKDRYGSGSSGLNVINAEALEDFLGFMRADGGALDRIVVQTLVDGQEFGIDVVCSLDGGGMLAGVLARKKLGMRGGETSSAAAENAAAFVELSSRIASVLKPRGLIDVDVILTADGRISVLDVNPRFGGGYPFSHVAGANVPLFYVAQLAGIAPPRGWDDYEVGTVSAKHEGIVRLDS